MSANEKPPTDLERAERAVMRRAPSRPQDKSDSKQISKFRKAAIEAEADIENDGADRVMSNLSKIKPQPKQKAKA